MPLSAREQRILTEIEDQLTRQDPELSDLFSSRPPSTRWVALPIGVTVWAVVVALLQAAGAGFADAALIAVAVVVLIGVHVARHLARRALFRRLASDGHDAHRRRSHTDD